MEKLKTLTIILSFLLFLSTIISIGVFCLFDFRYFEISLGTTYILSTFFILSFTKEVIQKSDYNIFYVKIKPEFPQYSPFYLEILLKERKNRNKIIFYYTYGLSWEKKQKKWVNVKNGLFITFKLFLIIKSFIII